MLSGVISAASWMPGFVYVVCLLILCFACCVGWWWCIMLDVSSKLASYQSYRGHIFTLFSITIKNITLHLCMQKNLHSCYIMWITIRSLTSSIFKTKTLETETLLSEERLSDVFSSPPFSKWRLNSVRRWMTLLRDKTPSKPTSWSNYATIWFYKDTSQRKLLYWPPTPGKCSRCAK